jgi:hypothetical protein
LVYTYRRELSDQQAIDSAQSLLRQIENTTAVLRTILDRHADLIVKRWRSMSTAERGQVLATAAPGLPATPWSSWELGELCENPSARWRANSVALVERHEHRRRILESALVPWLSAERLAAHPDMLLALLYYRTTYASEEWAPLDWSQLSHG